MTHEPSRNGTISKPRSTSAMTWLGIVSIVGMLAGIAVITTAEVMLPRATLRTVTASQPSDTADQLADLSRRVKRLETQRDKVRAIVKPYGIDLD